MNKPLFVISCPIDTYSGYGARSRDLVKAIISTNRYEVKILPQRWGATPWGFLDDHKEWVYLKNYILTSPKLDKQPDIWMQITIPNEFQPVGKYNIGVTAGIETTSVHQSWIEGCNRINLVITSSEFAKKILQTTQYEVKDKAGNPQGILSLKTPVEVLFEGADTNIYKHLENVTTTTFDKLDSINEDFAYLFVGHWVQGDFGEDRKNVGVLIKAFYETFKNKKNKPALILKTSGAGSSYMDRDAILNKIYQIKQSVNSTNLPSVYLLHGEFTDVEMNELYNHSKVKAMVSLTKGEGFGRPLLEFSLSKKPILTTNWSAHTEFLKPEFTTLVNGELKKVHKSALVDNILIEESQWFNANLMEVNYFLKDIHSNYKKYKEKANRQAFYSKTNFNWEEMSKVIDNILLTRVPEQPKEIELQLPKLNLPKLQKING
jgi:glycosyltransferase involved in cell wall biosynthesis